MDRKMVYKFSSAHSLQQPLIFAAGVLLALASAASASTLNAGKVAKPSNSQQSIRFNYTGSFRFNQSITLSEPLSIQQTTDSRFSTANQRAVATVNASGMRTIKITPAPPRYKPIEPANKAHPNRRSANLTEKRSTRINAGPQLALTPDSTASAQDQKITAISRKTRSSLGVATAADPSNIRKLSTVALEAKDNPAKITRATTSAARVPIAKPIRKSNKPSDIDAADKLNRNLGVSSIAAIHAPAARLSEQANADHNGEHTKQDSPPPPGRFDRAKTVANGRRQYRRSLRKPRLTVRTPKRNSTPKTEPSSILNDHPQWAQRALRER